MRLLLFDIDGTLLLTGGAGSIAFDRAFEELHRIPDAWGETSPDGKTDPVIFDEIFERVLHRKPTPDEFEALRKRYIQYFWEALEKAPRFRLMPGIPELLQLAWETREVLLGVATGNFEVTAWLKLERGGIRSYFAFGGFGSDSRDRLRLTEKALERAQDLTGEETSRDEVYLIGDTSKDVEVGKALGLRTVAVATGKLSVKELKRFRPDFLFKDFSKPHEVLGRLGLLDR